MQYVRWYKIHRVSPSRMRLDHLYGNRKTMMQSLHRSPRANFTWRSRFPDGSFARARPVWSRLAARASHPMSTQIVMPSQLAARRNMCVTLTRMVEDKVHGSHIHVAGRPRLDRRLPVFDQSAECSRVGAIKNRPEPVVFCSTDAPDQVVAQLQAIAGTEVHVAALPDAKSRGWRLLLRTAHGYGPEGSKPTASSSHRRHIRGRGVLRMANGCTGDRVDGAVRSTATYPSNFLG